MLLAQIQLLFNTQLAGEMLRYDEITPFIDRVIDDINADLCTNYPTFSEFNPITYPGYKKEYYTIIKPDGTEEIDIAKQTEVYSNYDFFPDKYIRSTVIIGGAYYWYIMDEEGISAAPMLQQQYFTNKFMMLRDYADQVPRQYSTLEHTTGALTDRQYYQKYVSESDIFGNI